MKEDILKMVVALKAIGYPVSKIEAELKFSNGLIGKAAKGESQLSDEKFKELNAFFELKTGVQKKEVVSTKIVSTPLGLKEKPSNEKMAILKATLAKIDKDFGKGAVMLMGDNPQAEIEVISTGSLSLDMALGVNGLPTGRVVEIYGPESAGKTTIATHVIAEAQKLGGTCAFIDAEHAFDSSYAAKLGVIVDDLILSQPDYGEQGLEIADRLISSGQISVIVIDSVAALVPKGELEGEMGDSKMGLMARLMSQALRKMTASIARTNTICIFINQLREKIGVVYGNPETTTGGNALKFYASVRLDVRKKTIKDGDTIIGNNITVKVIKNKVAPPFKVANFDMYFGEGICKNGEIVDLAAAKGVITKSGSWFSYNGTQLGQGKDQVVAMLKDNPAMAEELENKIKSIKA